MRTLYNAWIKQTLGKLSLSPMLLSLYLRGRQVPRTQAPSTSHIQGRLSLVFRTFISSALAPSFSSELLSLLPMLLNTHFHGASQR